MTLHNKKGLLNVCESVLYTLQGALPAAISKANAENALTVIAPLPGPYVLDSDKTFQLSPMAAAVTIPAGEYNAVALAVYLNAKGDFSAHYKAGVALKSRLAVMSNAKGNAAAETMGDGSLNAVLGIAAGAGFAYMPISPINEWVIRQPGFDGMFADYPALRVFCGTAEPTSEAGGEMVDYTVECRLYDVMMSLDDSSMAAIYRNLSHTAELISIAFAKAKNGAMQVDGHSIISIKPGRSIETVGGTYRAWVDFDLKLSVQENLGD